MRLLACQVSVTVGDSGLCRSDVFRALVHSLCIVSVSCLCPSLFHISVLVSVCLSVSLFKKKCR